MKQVKKSYYGAVEWMKRYALVGGVSVFLLLLLLLLGMFNDGGAPNPRMMSRVATNNASSGIEFTCVSVNPVIARQYNLPSASGALVNSIPTGTARRVFDIRRGDIVLEYNNVPVQSANHLSYLMGQNTPGSQVTFLLYRNGKTITIMDKLPAAATTGIGDMLGPKSRDIIIVLVILAGTFTLLFMNIFNRTVCVVLGAVLMLVAGSVFGFYKQSEAFDAIRMSPIFILIGMSIFAIFLEELKFFNFVSRRIIIALKGDGVKIIIAFCALTAVASAFVDNISTVLIIMPVTIYVAKGLGFNPVPLVISEIIASNIGGTATAIGDFPNMLISSASGLNFVDFMVFLTPINVLFLAIFLWYMWFTEFRHQHEKRSERNEKMFLKKVRDELATMTMDWPAIKRVLTILGVVLVSFVILPYFKIQLPQIALGGGFALLAIENKRAKDIIKQISLMDILFFIALFLLVGGALFSGLLNVISNILTTMSMGNNLLYLILLMWSMAFFTAILNSGPATAFFIPIVMHSGFADFTDVVWWAVSLGSLAGACACMSGASAGIVAPTIVEELHTAHLDGKDQEHLTFMSYSKRGVPIALIFLVISSVYLWLLNSIP